MSWSTPSRPTIVPALSIVFYHYRRVIYLYRGNISRRLVDTEYKLLFFNDPAPTEIYTLSLHDALPIFQIEGIGARDDGRTAAADFQKPRSRDGGEDRKSTRLNSSHMSISYAVFCL